MKLSNMIAEKQNELGRPLNATELDHLILKCRENQNPFEGSQKRLARFAQVNAESGNEHFEMSFIGALSTKVDSETWNHCLVCAK